MIRFRYNKTSRSYRVRMDLQKNDKDLILMKFDTGASDTIITTGALGISKVQEDALLKSIQNEKLEANEFTSVSGNHFTGYPCYCDDLRIGDVQVRRFYYYIVFGDIPKALLGDDFISCCTFSHSYKNDIVVTGFNSEEYRKQRAASARHIDIFEALI